MQPYRIEEMAKAIYDEADYSAPWSRASDFTREVHLIEARKYAAVLLGGEPTVEVQHGVKGSGGKVAGPYKVAQTVIGDDMQVVREKVVYPAAAFVTPWVKYVAPRRPSTAPSARYTVDCPACGARSASERGSGDGEACRAKSGRVTDTHQSRIDAQYPN